MPIRTTLSQRNRRKGVKTWYARIFDTETKEIRYESLRTTKKTEAADLMEAKKKRGEFDKTDSITISQGIKLLQEDNRRRGFCGNTEYLYDKVSKILEPIAGRTFDSVTTEEIIECMESLKPCEPSSYNAYLTKIRRLYNFVARRTGNMNITIKVKAIERQKVPQRNKVAFWTMEQINTILDKAPSPDIRLAWSFMAFAGLRRSEVVHLKPSDIKEGWIEVVGKGDKFARVPVGSRLASEIARYGKPFDFRKKNSAIYYYLKKITEEIGAEAGHPHTFRHSFASNLIRGHAGMKATQMLLRHENIQLTLDTYSHLTDDDLKDSIDLMKDG